MIKIFDSCIAPTLLYGSEFGLLISHYTKWESTPIERIHTQYLKRLLGVNRSTTNILVRGETGRNPLLASTLTRNINYIKYFNNKCNSTLVKQALDYETSNEIHFLITCDAYTERIELFNHLSTTVPVLFNLDNISKFTFLMSQEGIITTKLLVSQVSKMTEERIRLIQQQLI